MLILRKIINPLDLPRLNLPQQTRHVAQVVVAGKVAPVQMTINDIPVIDSHNDGLCLKSKRAELFEVRQHLADPLLNTAERMTARDDPLDVG